MAAEIKTDQRITRLTPLADVLAQIDSEVKPVAPRMCDVASARGHTLAADACAGQDLPQTAIALRDGFAVSADATRDASSYAPVVLPAPPFVNAGAILPTGTDSILPQDVVTLHDGQAEIVAAATTGDGVLPQGSDANAATPLLYTGNLLSAHHVATLQAAGLSKISVRTPKVALAVKSEPGSIVDAAHGWLMHAVTAAGGQLLPAGSADIEAILKMSDADFVISIGGTGSGRNDHAVNTLARAGKVACHGIAIAPGGTAALGFAGAKPVLLMPGRLDATIACWLLIAEPIIARLCDRQSKATGRPMRLSRKVTSSPGITEIVPVSCVGEDAEPLASDYLSLQTLARADGWIVVPAQSEGYPAGTAVTVRAFP